VPVELYRLLAQHMHMKKISSKRTGYPELGAAYDELLARMQTPKARKAARAAFNATPQELGRAAVKAARQRRV
jgi:hypothetical protein